VLAVFGGVVLAIAGSGDVSDAGGNGAAFAASTIAGTAVTGLVLASRRPVEGSLPIVSLGAVVCVSPTRRKAL